MQVDIKNAFNKISQAIIYRKLQDPKGPLASILPFIRLFYGVHFSYYYQHGQHEEGFTNIGSSLNTR